MIHVVSIIVLSLIIVAQFYIIFRLLDRLMSRNYYDFKTTENLDNKLPPKAIPVEEEELEDLNYISGLGGM